MNFLNSNKTKWIPLGHFSYGGTNIIVFARGNKKTGMMDFKIKKVNSRWFDMNNLISSFNFIKVEEQWNKLLKMMEEK